ncbi:LpqN/LpqT family lipoprotein [Rhodococcus sp. X156]|uniref:LpqN/LpqT family lipoprotein n=1 Tax=Rhodococcus sp. X156 TaxID=2499145 RepID=UPI000FD6DFE7|nr:LpqN/LpqT family lipoprotein [Rhodococcus sp. X156]
MSTRMKTALALATVGIALAAGCSSEESGAAQADPAATTSAAASSSTASSSTSSAPTSTTTSAAPTPAPGSVTLTSPDPRAPKLTVTPPAGWTQSTEKISESPDLIGAFLVNDARANDFTPNTTIVISNITGKAGSKEEALALDKKTLSTQLAGYVETGTKPLTVSGSPGQRITGQWTSPQVGSPLLVTVTSVAVNNDEGLFLVDLVSQSTQTLAPGWEQAVQSFHESLVIS